MKTRFSSTEPPAPVGYVNGVFAETLENGVRKVAVHVPSAEASPTGPVVEVFTDLGDVPPDYTGDSLKLVRVNAGETGLEFVSPTSSGGGSTAIGTYASLPAAGNAGNLYLCTNSPYFLRDNGATWDHFVQGIKVVPPISGDFTWTNQGGASISTTSGGVYLLAPAGSGDNLRIRKKAIPGSTYTIEVGFLANIAVADFAGVGVGFRQSSDGKLHTASIRCSSALGLASTKYNTESSFNNEYKSTFMPPMMILVFLQISDDGSNRIIRTSTDNQNWIGWHSISRTDFLTADQIIFFANSNNSTYDAGMHLLHWRQF